MTRIVPMVSVTVVDQYEKIPKCLMRVRRLISR